LYIFPHTGKIPDRYEYFQDYDTRHSPAGILLKTPRFLYRARHLQKNAGYWSQDAAVQVLGLQESPVALWIRWPGGKEQTVPLKDQEWTVNVGFEK